MVSSCCKALLCCKTNFLRLERATQTGMSIARNTTIDNRNNMRNINPGFINTTFCHVLRCTDNVGNCGIQRKPHNALF